MPLASRPSMVTTARPATSLIAVAQARAAWPSIWTVQEPHWAMPQPYFVPVNPSSSRRYQSSGIDPSPSKACSWPLTRNLTIGHLPRMECKRFACRACRGTSEVASSCLERRPGRSAGVIGPTSAGVLLRLYRRSRISHNPYDAGARRGGDIRRDQKAERSGGWHVCEEGIAAARQAPRGETKKDGMSRPAGRAPPGARQRRAQGHREPKPERLDRGRPALGQREMTGGRLLAPFAGSQGRIGRLIDLSQPTIADRESPLTRSKSICRLDLLRSGPPALRHGGPPPLAWFWQAV